MLTPRNLTLSVKKAYGRQIEDLMRSYVNHVTKVEFLSTFKTAFSAAMTVENIQGVFRGAGLSPLNLDHVLAQLDVKLTTPTPTGSPPLDTTPWISKTPPNIVEAAAQSTHIKTRISSRQNSSSTSILAAVDQNAKGTISFMHQVALLEAENSSLRKANKTLSRRRGANKLALVREDPLLYKMHRSQ